MDRQMQPPLYTFDSASVMKVVYGLFSTSLPRHASIFSAQLTTIYVAPASSWFHFGASEGNSQDVMIMLH